MDTKFRMSTRLRNSILYTSNEDEYEVYRTEAFYDNKHRSVVVCHSHYPEQATRTHLAILELLKSEEEE